MMIEILLDISTTPDYVSNGTTKLAGFRFRSNLTVEAK